MECDHYFEWGYTLAPCVYCTKCKKELDELGINESILSTHDVVNGRLVLRQRQTK